MEICQQPPKMKLSSQQEVTIAASHPVFSRPALWHGQAGTHGAGGAPPASSPARFPEEPRALHRLSPGLSPAAAPPLPAGQQTRVPAGTERAPRGPGFPPGSPSPRLRPDRFNCPLFRAARSSPCGTAGPGSAARLKPARGSPAGVLRAAAIPHHNRPGPAPPAEQAGPGSGSRPAAHTASSATAAAAISRPARRGGSRGAEMVSRNGSGSTTPPPSSSPPVRHGGTRGGGARAAARPPLPAGGFGVCEAALIQPGRHLCARGKRPFPDPSGRGGFPRPDPVTALAGTPQQMAGDRIRSVPSTATPALGKRAPTVPPSTKQDEKL